MAKFHKHTIQGELSPTDAQAAIGEAASLGTILRIESREGQTHVWVSTPETAPVPEAGGRGPRKGRSKVKVVEVAESDVTKIE